MGPFNFKITATEVQVRLGSWVVRRVTHADIVRACIATEWRVPLWNEHWCNFTPSRYIVLRRKSGWVRNFIINPGNTAEFLVALRREAPGIAKG